MIIHSTLLDTRHMLETNLTGHFLIAMPMLEDPNFFHTVTYVCSHTEEGAMGIVINRPLDVQLSDVFEHMEITSINMNANFLPIYHGGPVQPERGFVLHKPAGHWEAMMRMGGEEMGVTTSRDIIEALAVGAGPDKILIALGYAGWGSGQLEQEMADNAWLSTPADDAIIFDTPAEQRWQAAASKLGIDMNLLSTQAGHG